MKKQLLLVVTSLIGLSSLVGCNNENSSLDEVKKALENASGNVNFSGEITSMDIDEGDSESEGSVDITITESFMDWQKTYNENNSYPVSYRYTFQKDDDGYISYDRLTLMNVVERTRFVNPGSDSEMLYDDYCYNPLKELNVEDFEYIDGRYVLKPGYASAFNGLASLASTTMFHYYECEVSSASFDIQNGVFKSVSLTTKPQSNGYYNPSDFSYDFALDIFFPGEVEITPVVSKPHRAEHDVLSSALNSLQEKINGHNYTIDVIDKEDGGSFYGEYKVYVTEDTFLTSYRQLVYPYVCGYDKMEDGSFRKFYYYLYDDINTPKPSGHLTGDKVFVNESSLSYSLKRSDIEMDLTKFVPEFFIKSGSSFVCSNGDVVDAIAHLSAPYTESTDEYLIASQIFFNLDASNEISSWGFKMFDYYSGYGDTITYKISKVGETVIPDIVQIKKDLVSEE